MSLIEEVQNPSTVSPARAALNRPLRKTLGDIQARLSQEPAPEPTTFGRRPEPAPTADDPSLDLIDRASKGMTFIINRYKHLEDHIKQLDAWSNAQIHTAETAAARWKEAAAIAEKKLDDAQRNLDSMVRRAEAAEQSMQRDNDALKTLQDRIVAAFGLGSEAHDALSAAMDVH